LDKRKNTQIGLVFIDLSKAFDKVPHNLLLAKLFKIGIKHKELNLLTSYFQNRQQFVNSNNLKNTIRIIKCRVPQGSILSPLLFNIFINDIVKLPLIGRIISYADDICLKYESTNSSEIIKYIESDLKMLNEWFILNKLSINLKKTKYMFISPKHIKNDNILIPKLNNCEIERVQEYKYLGLYIDSDLKWTTHIQHIKSKILPFIGILKRLRNMLHCHIKKQIYFSFIQSHLNYLNMLWGAAAQIHIKCIKVLQNYASKSIFNLPYLEPTINVYNISKIFLTLLL
jgi:ribonuclease P/MRP protein subunit RPP40